MSTPDSRAPSLLYAVKRLELIIRARLDDMLRGSGVTTLQYTALTVLERRDGISAAQLARDSFVTPQAMSDMLRALTKGGYISRGPNPASRRELLVFLTDEGRDLLEAFRREAVGLEERMLASFTSADAEEFGGSLDRAWRALRDGSNARDDAGVPRPAATSAR